MCFPGDLFMGVRGLKLWSSSQRSNIYATVFSDAVGETEEHIQGCLFRETTWTVILYSEHSSATRCRNNRMTEKYSGFYKIFTLLLPTFFFFDWDLLKGNFYNAQAHTFSHQRSRSPWWKEVEPERQQPWPGRDRDLLPTGPPTRTGPSLYFTTLLWLITRLTLNSI